MKIKHMIYMLPLAGLLAGCNQEKLTGNSENVPETNAMWPELEAHAGIAIDGLARTELKNGSILWQTDDKLSVFAMNGKMAQYVLKEGVATKQGTFAYVKEATTAEGEPAATSQRIGIYPYSPDYKMTVNAGETPSYTLENVIVPTVQKYVPNTFDVGAYPMVAFTDNTTLQFKNLAAGLQLQLKGDCKVKEIAVFPIEEGAMMGYGEMLSGQGTVTVDAQNQPVYQASESGENMVTLDCDDQGGVQLDVTTPTSFYIALTPVELTNGFTVRITNTYGDVAVLKAQACTIKQNHILRMPEVNFDEHVPVVPSNEFWVKYEDNSLPWQISGYTQKMGDSVIPGYVTFEHDAGAITVFPSLEGQRVVDVKFPSGTNFSITKDAFVGCPIETFTMPANATNNGQNLFGRTPELKTITIYPIVTNLFALNESGLKDMLNVDLRLYKVFASETKSLRYHLNDWNSIVWKSITLIDEQGKKVEPGMAIPGIKDGGEAI